METTLHRQLKNSYAASDADTEVRLGGFRIDAVRKDELVEIQYASFSALSGKAKRLLARHQLRIVKPIANRTRLTRLAEPGGEVLSRRLSPKRGSVIDVFDDLIYFTRVFPHPNLTIEVVMVDVEQIRVPAKKTRCRGRWKKDYYVDDVRLESIISRHEFSVAADLLELIDWPVASTGINTEAIAAAIGRPRQVAQKIAYVLKRVGAIHVAGRKRSGILYSAA